MKDVNERGRSKAIPEAIELDIEEDEEKPEEIEESVWIQNSNQPVAASAAKRREGPLKPNALRYEYRETAESRRARIEKRAARKDQLNNATNLAWLRLAVSRNGERRRRRHRKQPANDLPCGLPSVFGSQLGELLSSQRFCSLGW